MSQPAISVSSRILFSYPSHYVDLVSHMYLWENIVGSLDPYLHGNIALYNVCDPDTAFIFDHAKGHTLPRDKHMVKELGDTVRRMIAEVNGAASP
jgi:hypothetical protein